MSTKIAILVMGIKVKLDRGEALDSILASYVKLTEAEKDEIRKHFTS